MDAVGRRIKFGGRNSNNPWLEIIGVVETARLVELDLGEEEAMFQPLLPLRYAYPTLSLLVRTRSDPMASHLRSAPRSRRSTRRSRSPISAQWTTSSPTT